MTDQSLHSVNGSHASEAFATPLAGLDYLASDAHYRSLCGRIVASLPQAGGIVLVTGVPPPSAEVISENLGRAAAREVAVISCEPNMTTVERLRQAVAHDALPLRASGTTSPAARQSPILFVLEEADRLTDAQIADICDASAIGDRTVAGAVLLAWPAFVERLGQSELRALNERVVARYRLQQLGRDEIEPFLRHQLRSIDMPRAFSNEVIVGIAEASDGDPAIVNRLAYRVFGVGLIVEPPTAPVQVPAAAPEPEADAEADATPQKSQKTEPAMAPETVAAAGPDLAVEAEAAAAPSVEPDLAFALEQDYAPEIMSAKPVAARPRDAIGLTESVELSGLLDGDERPVEARPQMPPAAPPQPEEPQTSTTETAVEVVAGKAAAPDLPPAAPEVSEAPPAETAPIEVAHSAETPREATPAKIMPIAELLPEAAPVEKPAIASEVLEAAASETAPGEIRTAEAPAAEAAVAESVSVEAARMVAAPAAAAPMEAAPSEAPATEAVPVESRPAEVIAPAEAAEEAIAEEAPLELTNEAPPEETAGADAAAKQPEIAEHEPAEVAAAPLAADTEAAPEPPAAAASSDFLAVKKAVRDSAIAAEAEAEQEEPEKAKPASLRRLRPDALRGIPARRLTLQRPAAKPQRKRLLAGAAVAAAAAAAIIWLALPHDEIRPTAQVADSEKPADSARGEAASVAAPGNPSRPLDAAQPAADRMTAASGTSTDEMPRPAPAAPRQTQSAAPAASSAPKPSTGDDSASGTSKVAAAPATAPPAASPKNAPAAPAPPPPAPAAASKPVQPAQSPPAAAPEPPARTQPETAGRSEQVATLPIPPIKAPPANMAPIATTLSQDSIRALLERGDAYLGNGDIVTARLYYERAAEAGDGHAALLMGETYDPVLLAMSGARGVRGDVAVAAAWYRRARDLGATEAETLLNALRAK